MSGTTSVTATQQVPQQSQYAMPAQATQAAPEQKKGGAKMLYGTLAALAAITGAVILIKRGKGAGTVRKYMQNGNEIELTMKSGIAKQGKELFSGTVNKSLDDGTLDIIYDKGKLIKVIKKDSNGNAVKCHTFYGNNVKIEDINGERVIDRSTRKTPLEKTASSATTETSAPPATTETSAPSATTGTSAPPATTHYESDVTRYHKKDY